MNEEFKNTSKNTQNNNHNLTLIIVLLFIILGVLVGPAIYRSVRNAISAHQREIFADAARNLGNP